MEPQNNPLKYLRTELGIGLGELTKLSEKDRKELREYAAAEMRHLGIPFTETNAK